MNTEFAALLDAAIVYAFAKSPKDFYQFCDGLREYARLPANPLPCGYCDQTGSHRENCPGTWWTTVAE